MWWIELKDGSYLQNPAYFPRIYLWIFDKYSSTSFWQRLLTEFLNSVKTFRRFNDETFYDGIHQEIE